MLSLSEIQHLRLRATFHALPLFYLRTWIYERTHVIITRHWNQPLFRAAVTRVITLQLCDNLFGLPTWYCAVVSILNSTPFHVSAWFPLRSQTFCSNEPTLPYTRKLPILAPFMWYRKTTQCEPVKIGDTRRARSSGCRGDDASA